MNILDIGICVVTCYFFVRGVFGGILREVASILGAVLGYIVAYNYYRPLAGCLSLVTSERNIQDIVAFSLIFSLIVLASGLLGSLARRFAKVLLVGWADRILGGVFGLGKGVFIVSVLLLALAAFLPKKPVIIEKSVLARYIINISSKLETALPDDLHKRFQKNLKELREAWVD
ncbi:MAG: CvpA family protein [Pseudomonadota bacterium]